MESKESMLSRKPWMEVHPLTWIPLSSLAIVKDQLFFRLLSHGSLLRVTVLRPLVVAASSSWAHQLPLKLLRATHLHFLTVQRLLIDANCKRERGNFGKDPPLDLR